MTEYHLFNAWQQLGLAKAQNGRPLCNVANVFKILTKWPPVQGLVWLDPETNRIMTHDSSGDMRPWSSIDNMQLTLRLQSELRLDQLSEHKVYQAIKCYISMQEEPNYFIWKES